MTKKKIQAKKAKLIRNFCGISFIDSLRIVKKIDSSGATFGLTELSFRFPELIRVDEKECSLGCCRWSEPIILGKNNNFNVSELNYSGAKNRKNRLKSGFPLDEYLSLE